MENSKKINILLVILVSLFIVTWFLPESNQSNPEQKLTLNSANTNNLQVYFFYGEGCPHCAKVEPLIEEIEAKYPVKINKYDIYTERDKLSLFDEYNDRYGIPSERRGVPTMFISNDYFIGDGAIISSFEDAVKSALEEKTDSSTFLNEENLGNTNYNSIGAVEQVSLFTITASALVDAISPCSIAILVFLIGARVLVSGFRKRALRVGLAFCLSVFLGYFLFGIGLFNVIQLSGFSGIFSVLVGLIALVAGLLYIKDVFWYRRGGFAMEVPNSLKPALMKMLKRVTSPVGAFLMGFVVVCFELPCTGGPYLFILGQLANSTTRLQTIPLLLYYNFIFVLPLILITLLLYSNILSLDRVRLWNERNLRLLRLGGGLVMIFLGLIVIPTSLILSFISVFLAAFRFAGPLILFSFLVYFLWHFRRLLIPPITRARKWLFRPSLLGLSLILPIVTMEVFVGMSPSMNSVSGSSASNFLVGYDFDNRLAGLIHNGLNSGKVVLVYFYLETCNWCQQQTKIIDDLEKEFSDITVIRVNGADVAEEALGRFGVKSYPTILFIKDNQDRGELFYGLTGKEDLEKKILDSLEEVGASFVSMSIDSHSQTSEFSVLAVAAQSIDSCMTISSPGTYYLASDILDSSSETCITITSDDVVLDGQNHKIDGTASKDSIGVFVHNPSTLLNDVIVKNLFVSNWHEGIYFLNTIDSIIDNNHPSQNYIGIHLEDTSYSSITSNTASGYNNENSYAGIYLSGYTYRITIQDNVVTSYWVFGVYLVGSQTTNVIGNTLKGQGQGIELTSSSTYITIEDNLIQLNKYGIEFESGCHSNIIKHNQISLNSLIGINLVWADDNIIQSNIIEDNYDTLANDMTTGIGIQMHNCMDNQVYNNLFNNFQNFRYSNNPGFIYENSWNTEKTSGVNIIGGPYLGGNYWGDFYGYGSGISDDCKDADGDYICDSSHSLGGANIDYLPLKNFLDKDGDGVGDPEDNCPDYANSDQANSDGDNYGDVCDNCRYVNNNDQIDTNENCPAKPFASDPRCGDICEESDTDGDLIPDTQDNCPIDANPDQKDSDNDQAGDACDNCPTVYNPDQANGDLDNLGNACDNCWSGTPNPGQEDSDGDCSPYTKPYSYDPRCGDACDQCPSDPNKIFPGDCGCGNAETDSDNDGKPDCIDKCPSDRSKTEPGICGCGVPDTDDERNSYYPYNTGDGYVYCNDNCPTKYNPNQEDADGDGVGDVCDTCYLLPNADQQEDSDGDGYGDLCDNCPSLNANTQRDSDGDGLGDPCDPDDDNDGLLDPSDNCPTIQNNQFSGTCTQGSSVGASCNNPGTNTRQCGTNGFCSMNQEDTDGSGIGDACNDDVDSDGDEWENSYDNCPKYNPDQRDDDNNGIGDKCESDLAIVRVEITQGIQDNSNSLPLFSGKDIWIRVYLSVGQAQLPIGPVNGYLRFLDSNGYPLYIFNRYPAGQTLLYAENSIIAPVNPDSGNITHTLNFLIPSYWGFSGVPYIDLTVFLEGLNWNDEINPWNNFYGPFTLDFQGAKPLNIVFVPVKHAGCTPTLSDFLQSVSYVKKVYPINQVNMYQSSVLEYDDDPTIHNEDLLFEIWLRNLWSNDPLDNMRYFGLVCARSIVDGQGNTAGTGGTAFINNDEAWGMIDDPPSPRGANMAHELGHNFGRSHAPCGNPPDVDPNYPQYYPYPSGSIGAFGFDGSTVYSPEDYRDFMTYCDPEWVSPYTYKGLYSNEFALTAAYEEPKIKLLATTNLNREYLAIIGTVTPDDEIEVLPFRKLTFPAGTYDTSGTGAYSIELQGNSGDTLFIRYFDTFATSGEITTKSILEVIPYQSGTARIIIKHGDSVLKSIMVSANQPQVTIQYPNGGETLAGLQLITWSATDFDNDKLVFDIIYSEDGGNNWSAIATGLDDNEFLWDTESSPGTSQGLIRVIASDGVNNGIDDSDSEFSVARKAPEPLIFSPTNNDIYFVNRTILLEGTAYDLEDGQLEGNSLLWSSSLNGTLATGSGVTFENLVPGKHEITLAATDSDGNTRTTTTTITVQSTLDSDGDGIADELDNCQYTYNPDQKDSDNDGVGTICDLDDSDNDGYPDFVDNCSLMPNDQTDANQNGVGDACESDDMPPSGSIVINNNDVSTSSTSVTLTLQAEDDFGVAEMRFSSDNSTWSNWQPYNASATWTLQGGDGVKTVYVQFKDNTGLISTYSDTITLTTSTDTEDSSTLSDSNSPSVTPTPTPTPTPSPTPTSSPSPSPSPTESPIPPPEKTSLFLIAIAVGVIFAAIGVVAFLLRRRR